MFRNYANLLTGFYIFRPDEPVGTGIEHFITDGTATNSGGSGAYRSLYGLGAYYPSAGFYWPFGTQTAPVGVDSYPTYSLVNPTIDPDPLHSEGNGGSRHVAYSLNMLSSDATPEWYGELFYKGTAGTGTVSGTGSTSVSTLVTSKSDWQSGAPSWITGGFDVSGEDIMTNESAHNTTNIPTASVWRPSSFIGTTVSLGSISPSDPSNFTGGYTTDGFGNYYRNSMGWSGRPTHYYDFSQSTWVAISDNHTANIQALPLGNWKVQEYAWHARASGVTIYTVGYGSLVSPAQQVILAQVANATNTTAGNSQGYDTNGNFFYTAGPGTSITYNPGQPIGQQYFATNSTDISNDFFQVGQAINAALTQ